MKNKIEPSMEEIVAMIFGPNIPTENCYEVKSTEEAIDKIIALHKEGKYATIEVYNSFLLEKKEQKHIDSFLENYGIFRRSDLTATVANALSSTYEHSSIYTEEEPTCNDDNLVFFDIELLNNWCYEQLEETKKEDLSFWDKLKSRFWM